MTVKELYDWAEKNNALDLEIEIPYRDGGGYYHGADECMPYISNEPQLPYHKGRVVEL